MEMGDPMSDKSIRCRILGGEKKTIMTPPLRKNREGHQIFIIIYHIIYYSLFIIFYIIYTYSILYYIWACRVWIIFHSLARHDMFLISRSRFDGKSQVTRGYFAMFPGKLIYP
jgi:hypothetical protein